MKKEMILSIANIPTNILRNIEGEVIKDFIIAVKDGVSITSWIEDINEEPEVYDYSPDDVMEFVNLVNRYL